MAKIICYIASSLDGKIARLNGDVSWLEQVPNPNKEDYGYSAFLNAVGITLMGNKTYQEVLGFGIEFPYKDKINYVFTTNSALKKDEYVTYVSEDIPSFVRQLKTQKEDIWLIGGGAIIALLLEHQLVDEIRLFVMPILLGAGIPLVQPLSKDIPLQLKTTKTYNSGVVELTYTLS
jgi:dihydrofolate reductase